MIVSGERLRPLGLVLGILILIPGCSPDNEFSWEWARLSGATEVVSATEIPELAEESESVVRGEFSGACGIREVRTDTAIDVVVYSCLRFDVTEVLDGVAPGESLKVEFLGALPEGGGVPVGEAVLFLVNKGGDESEYFRAVNSSGLWTATVDDAVDQPLLEEASHAPAAAQTDEWGAFLEELRGQLPSTR